ncbi:hypothetical protein RHOSPDRAFT_32141 [Rhodotorula sp. JG-1b]|nr:hypothetical protein RHOSPDRAFT_32141 [Rhodotorula sp. JG-1b]
MHNDCLHSLMWEALCQTLNDAESGYFVVEAVVKKLRELRRRMQSDNAVPGELTDSPKISSSASPQPSALPPPNLHRQMIPAVGEMSFSVEGSLAVVSLLRSANPTDRADLVQAILSPLTESHIGRFRSDVNATRVLEEIRSDPPAGVAVLLADMDG